MVKFTKIICTIGPACDTKKDIEKLFNSGMNVARLNFSHGSYDYFKQLIKTIREVSLNIAILLDTKGPEIRTGDIEDNFIELEDDQKLIFTKEKVVGNSKKISINYKYLNEVEVGNRVLIDDGLIGFKVLKKFDDGDLEVQVENGGILSSKKSVTIRGHNVKVPFLSKKDIDDVNFGIDEGLDFIAASFVREAKELKQLRNILDKRKSNIQIISKIEHSLSVENFDDILENSDGIMIARGDLGVEIPPEKVPQFQKEMIQKSREAAKPVIVATHMLESMKENPRPTRAEVSDVAQAIMQGTDAIMLSGETASGKYPVKSVQMMSRIAKEYDNKVRYVVTDNLIGETHSRREKTTLFITNSAYHASKNLGAKAILTPTSSGFTARGVSRFRPHVAIYAITNSMIVLRQLQLSRNVIPFYCVKKFNNKDNITKTLVKEVVDLKKIKSEDLVVVTAGSKVGEQGFTNMVEVYKVKDLL